MLLLALSAPVSKVNIRESRFTSNSVLGSLNSLALTSSNFSVSGSFRSPPIFHIFQCFYRCQFGVCKDFVLTVSFFSHIVIFCDILLKKLLQTFLFHHAFPKIFHALADAAQWSQEQFMHFGYFIWRPLRGGAHDHALLLRMGNVLLYLQQIYKTFRNSQ